MSSDKSSIIEKAQKLAAKGQVDKAIEEWQKLISETPNDGNIYNTIGDLHLKANHTKEAISSYLKAGEAFKSAGFELKSIAVFKKIIKVDASRVDVYEKLADVHAERGLTGNAIEDYLVAAKHYTKIGNIRSALTVYRKLANLDSENVGVRLKIGEMCLKEGLKKEAVEEYEKALSVYEKKQMTSEAQGLLGQILKIDPTYSKLSSGAPPAPAQEESPPQPLSVDTPQAPQEAPAPSMEQKPEIPEREEESLSARMEGTLKTGDWEEAERLIEALQEQPHALFCFLSKWVDFYLERGSLPKAYLILQKAVFIANEHSFFEDGRSLIQRYLNENPKQISAYELLGESFEKAGAPDEAIGSYSQVLSLLSEQGGDAKRYYEKVKSRLPAIAEIEQWKNLFEPSPVEPPPMEIISESVPEAASDLESDLPPVEPVRTIQEREEDETVVPISIGNEEETVIPPETSNFISNEISEATFQGHLTEAEVYIKYGLNAKAIDQLKILSELAPSREEPRLQLKELYLKEGMTELAVGELRFLARLYEKTGAGDKKEAVLNELSTIDPQGQYQQEESAPPPSSPQEKGVSLEESQAQKVSPKDEPAVLDDPPVPEKEGDLQSLKKKMDEVEIYLQNGKKEEAKSLLWRIMEENSSYTEARLKLLELQEKSKPSPDETLSPAAAPTATNETSFEGVSEEVERSFSDLMSGGEDSSPSHDEALFDKLAPEEEEASQEKGGYIDLTSIFSEELKETNEGATIDFSGIGLEDAFKEMQKGAEGRLNQEDYETHYNLGIAYKEMDLLPEAIKEFELAFQGDLRFQDASVMLAACYKEKGMGETAIEILKNAIEDPRCKGENIVALHYELAALYESERETQKAMTHYNEVYRLDSNYRDVAVKVSASLEKDRLEPSVPSGKGQAKPKSNPETKKKGRISYL